MRDLILQLSKSSIYSTKPIHSCTSQIVRYWRQGRINTASIDRFNYDFEHLDHREAAQIRAELETSEHIKSLRAQRAA
ncbi:DUF4222 domain-containing protein [Enterobacter cloacae]